MGSYHPSVSELWKRFVESYPEYTNTKYEAWYFCNNEKCANELAELVKKGIKKATTSLLYWYERGEEPMPEKGEINVITNWDGIVQCITITINVSVLKFRGY